MTTDKLTNYEVEAWSTAETLQIKESFDAEADAIEYYNYLRAFPEWFSGVEVWKNQRIA